MSLLYCVIDGGDAAVTKNATARTPPPHPTNGNDHADSGDYI
jgi:hypothetical protein